MYGFRTPGRPVRIILYLTIRVMGRITAIISIRSISLIVLITCITALITLIIIIIIIIIVISITIILSKFGSRFELVAETFRVPLYIAQLLWLD